MSWSSSGRPPRSGGGGAGSSSGAQGTIDSVLRDRECFLLGTPRRSTRKLHLPDFILRKLQLSATLRGHAGCVNRLAWNSSGTLLASGSDDCKVILWSYPCSSKPPVSIMTQHRANIFGVKVSSVPFFSSPLSSTIPPSSNLISKAFQSSQFPSFLFCSSTIVLQI